MEHVPNICKVPGVITAYRLKLEEAELSVGSRTANKSAKRYKVYGDLLIGKPRRPGSDAWAAQPKSAVGRRKYGRIRSIADTSCGRYFREKQ